MRMCLFATLLVLSTYAFSQDGNPPWMETGWCDYHYSDNEQPPSRMNIPAWVCEASYKQGLQGRYSPNTHMNPFFVSGDFDADGRTDIALWVRDKEGKLGILFLRQGRKGYFIAGAGSNTSDRGDDLSYVDIWSVISKGEVLDSHWEDKKIKLRGDAVLIEKSESSAIAIYWNGKSFSFYQLTD